jgi:signal transduction histidine kinase
VCHDHRVTLLRPLISRSTYRGWAWLILGGAVLMPYMMAGEVVRVFFWGADAEAFALAVQPVTFLAVLPVVALTGLVLPLRPLLTLTARSLLGADVPPAGERRDWPTRRRTAVWYTIQLAVGGVLSGLTLALLPFVALVAVLPLFPDPALVSGDLLAAGWQPWWGPVLGPVAVLGLIYAVAATGAGLRRLAPVLLGPTATDRLAEAHRHAAALAARNRIARDLHDSVGHALSVVTLQAAAAGRVLDRDQDFVRRALAAVEETARRALGDLDRALGVLREGDRRPDPAVPAPDLAQLPALLDNCGLVVDADVRVAPDILPGEVSREAYRIVQEALTNALRHGEGRTATLRVDRDDDGLTVAVANPVPAGVLTRPRGRGLVGMAERVAAFGGTLHTGVDGDRWRVRAHLPVAWSA